MAAFVLLTLPLTWETHPGTPISALKRGAAKDSSFTLRSKQKEQQQSSLSWPIYGMAGSLLLLSGLGKKQSGKGPRKQQKGVTAEVAAVATAGRCVVSMHSSRRGSRVTWHTNRIAGLLLMLLLLVNRNNTKVKSL